MMRAYLFAAGLLLAPAAAHGVTVTGITAPGPNSASVAFDGGDLLGLDYELFNSAPVVASLARPGGGSFAFNAFVESYFGLTRGRNLRQVTLTLDGASFTGPGSVSGAFSEARARLSPDARTLKVRFEPSGEGLSATIGNVFGGTDWTITMAGDSATLALQGAVPEPMTWAMMVLGFSVVGMAARRRRGLASA